MGGAAGEGACSNENGRHSGDPKRSAAVERKIFLLSFSFSHSGDAISWFITLMEIYSFLFDSFCFLIYFSPYLPT